MGVWFFTTGRNSGLEGAQGSKSLGRISESHVLSDSWFGALYSTETSIARILSHAS